MTKDEWKDYKDFDDLCREMNGIFGAQRLIPSEVSGTFLTPAEQKAVSVPEVPIAT